MNKIYTVIAILISISISFSSLAQINYGGTPSFLTDLEVLSERSVVTPPINRESLAQADAVTDQIKEVPWRFGVEHDVAYSPLKASFLH